MKLPYFPFYPDDYLSSTRVMQLSYAQRGIYVQLLCYAWKHPGARLPNDNKIIKRFCPGAKWSDVKKVLGLCFIVEGSADDSRTFNGRMADEWRTANAKHIKASETAKHREELKRQSRNVPETCPPRDHNQNQNQNQNHKKKNLNIGERKPRSQPDPQVNEVKEFFASQFAMKHGSIPAINHAQDGKLIKNALRIMPLEDLKSLILFFIDSQKARDLGCTLSIALSAHTINLYKQGGNNATRFDQLRAYFGLSGGTGSDGIHSRSNRAFGSDNKPEAGRNAGAVLDGKASEVSEVESEGAGGLFGTDESESF